MLNIGCQRSVTRHHGSYCRGEKKTCTRLCYNMQEANKTKWKLTRHWIKDASLQQNCYITPVEVYSKRWLGLVFCFPPQTQRRNKFFSMPKLLGSIWLGWNREDRKWWKKKKKCFVGSQNEGRKWWGSAVFSLGPPKLSPQIEEKTQVETCCYIWMKLSQSNVHIIWTFVSFSPLLFCFLLDFVFLSLLFSIYLLFRFFSLSCISFLPFIYLFFIILFFCAHPSFLNSFGFFLKKFFLKKKVLGCSTLSSFFFFFFFF